MAKDKVKSAGPTKIQVKQRRNTNSNHGRTFCKYCTKKIARGMQFCNNTCRTKFNPSIG